MDPKFIKELINAHAKLAELYRRAADAACSTNQTYEVYNHVKASMSEETKIRHIKNQYAHLFPIHN